MLKQRKNLQKELGDGWVLLVEPSQNYRTSIRSFMTNLKVSNLRIVSSIPEAKRELLTLKPGLVICEWDLPEMNGIQFCRDLRRDKTMIDVPFLLLTVENMRRDVVLASEVGIDGYLLKPFSYEDFADAVINVVRTRKSPSRVNIIIDQAEKFLAESKTGHAETMFREALDKNPASARALVGMARIARIRGDKDEAIRLYDKAIALNGDFVDSYRDLLEIYLEHGPTDKLVETAIKINDLSPDNPKYTLILARAHLEAGDHEESEGWFKRTIRLSPKLAEAYKGLGKINMIQEDYQSAMKNFSKALDLDNNDVSILNSLGLSYVRSGRCQEGIEKYRAALKLRPHDSRILFNLGYAKEKLGDLEEATFYYRQALSHSPEFEKAARRLKTVAEKSGKAG